MNASFRRKIFSVVFTSIVLLGLNACMSRGEVPEDHYYRLPPVASSGQLNTSMLDVPVHLEPVQASGILNERGMLYVNHDTENKINIYAYRHWVDKPATLIHQHWSDWLAAQGLTINSGTEGAVDDNTLVITPQLLQFERVMHDQGVAVDISMTIITRSAGVILATKTYHSRMDVDSQSVYDTVSAFGSALEIVYADWARDISSLPHR